MSKKRYYMADVIEVDRTYVTWLDEYIFDPDSRSLTLKNDGRITKVIPLTDPKYIRVVIYDCDRQHYPDPIETFIAGGVCLGGRLCM